MLFKLEYSVSELWLPADTELKLEIGGANNVRVEVYPRSIAENVSHQAFCTAFSVVNPNEMVDAVFAKIAANEMLPNDGSEKIGMQYVLPDGTTVRIPGLARFPDCFRSFGRDVQSELREAAFRVITVLRWRAGVRGPHNPMRTQLGFKWSRDGVYWHLMPVDTTGGLEIRRPLPWTDIRADLNQIVESGRNAPLHHELFREAWEQRRTNPRSALVIGLAVAEHSIKHCISELVPDAEWLAANLPTPPLVKILTEYFPDLPAKCNFGGHVKPPPASDLNQLKNGIKLRDDLLRAGAPSPSVDTIEPILLSVYDLLWLVDYYTGNAWALDYLRPETRAALTLP